MIELSLQQRGGWDPIFDDVVVAESGSYDKKAGVDIVRRPKSDMAKGQQKIAIGDEGVLTSEMLVNA